MYDGDASAHLQHIVTRLLLSRRNTAYKELLHILACISRVPHCYVVTMAINQPTNRPTNRPTTRYSSIDTTKQARHNNANWRTHNHTSHTFEQRRRIMTSILQDRITTWMVGNPLRDVVDLTMNDDPTIASMVVTSDFFACQLDARTLLEIVVVNEILSEIRRVLFVLTGWCVCKLARSDWLHL
jgi:hypothetical protein